jgi:hypothetical protein
VVPNQALASRRATAPQTEKISWARSQDLVRVHIQEEKTNIPVQRQVHMAQAFVPCYTVSCNLTPRHILIKVWKKNTTEAQLRAACMASHPPTTGIQAKAVCRLEIA